MLGEIQAKRKKQVFSSSLLKKVKRRPQNNNNDSFLFFTDDVKAGRNERTHQGYATQSGFKLRTSESNPSAWMTHSFSSLYSPTVLGHVATGEMKNRCRSMNRWETSPGWSLEDNTGLFSGKEDSKEPQRQHPCPKTEAALPHTKCYLHQPSKWDFWGTVCCLSTKDTALLTSQTCNIDISVFQACL